MFQNLKSKKRILFILGGIFFTFHASKSFAGPQQIIIRKPIPIYKVQNLKKGNRLTLVQPGTKLLLSPQNYGNWGKVLFLTGELKGKKGWAYLRHFKGRVEMNALDEDDLSDLPDISLSESLGQLYSQSTGIGFDIRSSYLQWGKRTFSLSDDSEWTVSDVTSTTYWLSLFVDLKMGFRKALRIYGGYRSTDFQGEATTDFLGTKAISFNQKFLELGALYKMYQPSMKFWYGIGLATSQGQEFSITYNGDTIPTTESDLSFYMLLYGSLGYDFSLSQDYYLLTSMNLGSIINQDPKIYFAELLLGLGYRL
ncbi:MAG: hypothetical protein KDD34_09720 [Bdellovibrionales bacterium]|nr:hypothetical protein [Bdellovibrionales bacterium]